MFGTVLILFLILCISIAIFAIKNYSFIQTKINKNLVFAGVVYALIILEIILVISTAIIYGAYALNNFGIININNYLE